MIAEHVAAKFAFLMQEAPKCGQFNKKVSRQTHEGNMFSSWPSMMSPTKHCGRCQVRPSPPHVDAGLLVQSSILFYDVADMYSVSQRRMSTPLASTYMSCNTWLCTHPAGQVHERG
jgi:hypothetical protein